MSSQLHFKTLLFTGTWCLIFLLSMMLIPGYDAHLFMASFITLSLGLFARIALIPKNAALNIAASNFYIWMGAFWLIAFISVINSEIPFVAYVYFCFLSMLPLSFLFSNMSADKPQYFKLIGISGVIILAALSTFCLIEYFFLKNWLFYGRTYYPLANSNSLAGLLGIGFFTTFGFMLHTDKRLHANIALALSALIFSAILTTQSRGGFLCVTFFTIVFSLLNLQSLKKHWRCISAVTVLAAIAFLLMSLPVADTHYQTPLKIAERSMTNGMPLLWDRPHIWASAWEIIKTHFWAGTGIGTFFLYYPEVRHLDYSTSGYMAHNDPLQFWTEMGVFSPIAFYATIIWFIYKTFKILKILAASKNYTAEEKRKYRIRILIPASIMAALTLQSHIEFNFYVLPSLVLMGTILAYWLWQIGTIQPEKRIPISKGSSPENLTVKLSLFLLLLAMGGIFTGFQSSELLVFYAKKKLEKDDLNGFVSQIHLANKVSFYRNARALTLTGTIPSGILRARKQLTEAEKINLFSQANYYFQRAAFL